MLFVRAYPRESQEMVFDAHDRAFAFFCGACVRGIYDNMKTAVEAVFIGKDRTFNRRFLRMCSHYLVELVNGHRSFRRSGRLKFLRRAVVW
jgi:transposase